MIRILVIDFDFDGKAKFLFGGKRERDMGAADINTINRIKRFMAIISNISGNK